MAEPSVRATYLQVSDLHLDPRGSASGAPHAPLPHFYRFHRTFDGLLGHHSVALGALEDFYFDLHAREVPMLIVTGDLTRNGHPDQFKMAEDFLGDVVRVPPKVKPIGLKYSSWQTLAIYGNHDHWAGLDQPLGRPAANLANYLHGTPDIRRQRLASGKLVIFMKINTDCDVDPFSIERFLGVGAFESEIVTLSQRLPAYDSSQIRVLIMHHSPNHRPAPWPQLPYGELEIHPDSRAALDRFLETQHVDIVLSGHTHESRLGFYTVATGSTRVMEARAGSTTQLDTHPAASQQFNATRPLFPNALIVHRVLEDGGRHVWRASIHQRSRTGFGLMPVVEIEVPV